MKPRAAARLAWSACALSLLLVAFGFVFLALNRSYPDPVVFGYWLENAALALAFPTVGALIASRNPSNPIGWLFLAAGLAGGGVLFASEYALYALFSEPGALPGGSIMAWLSSWLGTVSFGLAFAFLFLLFPDGRLLSARWRWVAWLAAVTMTVVATCSALNPVLTDEAGQAVPNGAPEPIENPLGIEGTGSLMNDLVGAATVIFVLCCALPAAASLILRYRRSRGEQRQQIKWLAYAAAALVVGIFVIPDLLKAIWGETDAVMATVKTLETAPVIGIPIATGIAILRHRLYDIDVVINRTLVYGALTLILAGAYLGSVLLLQLLLSPESDFAIAGSTLAAAALVRPARRRVQALVDRRFFRRKYDAQLTLESFGLRLRNEVDLDALGGELRTVVGNTMQPAHMSLWLKGAR